ncbi:MAG TPA: AmmeMemoRadiSam system protein B [Phycisphaeraceae bacterium]
MIPLTDPQIQTRPGWTRPAAVAGAFYPQDAAALRRLIETLLAQAAASTRGQKQASRPPKAIIAPHAGYRYSGPVAASAYAALAPHRSSIERVILLGPSHHAHFDGLAASSADAFETPLGPAPLDREAIHRLLRLPFVHIFDEAHAPEHSLEAHLPFLMHVLSRPEGDNDPPTGASSASFGLVPLLFNSTQAEQVADVLEELWDGPQTLIVVSSDLSHFLDYADAKRVDGYTAEAITRAWPWRIGPKQACGHTAIQGLLLAAQHHGLEAQAVDLRNSGDTAGPRDRVVGYGAFLFA